MLAQKTTRCSVLCFIFAFVVACRPPAPVGYQGYLEADYVYLGSAAAGRLTEMRVERGAQVLSGAALFALDDELEQAQVAQARALLAQARAQREDLSQGRRPAEIEVISKRVAEARAALNLAQLELTRTRDLHGRKLVSADALDRATSAQVQANARLQSLIAEQKSAGLAGRPDALIAADAAIASAEAALAGAQWRAKQTRVSAQASARVEDVLYQLGEWVPTGAPVLKLLPEQGPFVRFFVPMQALASWQPGALVALSCSACPAGLRARVNFIAAAPEYTPPVIFSETRSDDLVYRIEAKLEQPTLLAPGLPVVVHKL